MQCFRLFPSVSARFRFEKAIERQRWSNCKLQHFLKTSTFSRVRFLKEKNRNIILFTQSNHPFLVFHFFLHFPFNTSMKL
jgi:hypothetical protein